jgi:hypothetical protein
MGVSVSVAIWFFSEATGKPVLLSPHHMGWPEHRPRRYTCLTRKSTCFLDGQGLQVLYEIMRQPVMSVAQLFCAPEVGYSDTLT